MGHSSRKLLEDARTAFCTIQIQDGLPGTQTLRMWGWSYAFAQASLQLWTP
jgi:hypothetical protein